MYTIRLDFSGPPWSSHFYCFLIGFSHTQQQQQRQQQQSNLYIYVCMCCYHFRIKGWESELRKIARISYGYGCAVRALAMETQRVRGHLMRNFIVISNWDKSFQIMDKFNNAEKKATFSKKKLKLKLKWLMFFSLFDCSFRQAIRW